MINFSSRFCRTSPSSNLKVGYQDVRYMNGFLNLHDHDFYFPSTCQIRFPIFQSFEVTLTKILLCVEESFYPYIMDEIRECPKARRK